MNSVFTVTPQASGSAGPGPAPRARWAVASSPALQPTPPQASCMGPKGGPETRQRLLFQEDSGLSPPRCRGTRVHHAC